MMIMCDRSSVSVPLFLLASRMAVGCFLAWLEVPVDEAHHNIAHTA